jgi:drug/metabolite transporter (DMT)-like permease
MLFMENWLYLLLSVFFSAFITVAFKYFSRYKVNLFQAIIINYLVCIGTAIVVNKGIYVPNDIVQRPWFIWAIVMGCFFISFFNIMGITANTVGVSVTTVSNKLSLVIPFALSIYILQASYNRYNMLGCIVAIIAVILTNYTKASQRVKMRNYLIYILPIVLFLGSGLLDFIIKYATTQLMQKTEEYLFFIIGFTTAFIIGASVLLVQVIRGKQQIQRKNILAGIVLGVPNYFSFYFLVKFINSGLMSTAASIPVNNIAVVIGSAIMAFFVVKERLSIINTFGLVLAVLAIVLLAI